MWYDLIHAHNWDPRLQWLGVWVGPRFKAATLVICAKNDAKRPGSGRGLRQLLLSSVRKVMPKDPDRDKV